MLIKFEMRRIPKVTAPAVVEAPISAWLLHCIVSVSSNISVTGMRVSDAIGPSSLVDRSLSKQSGNELIINTNGEPTERLVYGSPRLALHDRWEIGNVSLVTVFCLPSSPALHSDRISREMGVYLFHVNVVATLNQVWGGGGQGAHLTLPSRL